jgi:Histidine kinase
MQLEDALRERTKAVEYKDILLAELQHQVRNNLQVIVSMINLQREKQASDMEVVSSRIQAQRGKRPLALDCLWNRGSSHKEICLVSPAPVRGLFVGVA